MIGFRQFSKATWLFLLLVSSGCATHLSPQAKSTEADLVDVAQLAPEIVLDIRYATANNFTGQPVYPAARCFLARDAAAALLRAHNDLRAAGYGLKVFDGYRPLSVQWAFWKIMPNPDYVADPRKGSRHNRGYAVDVSLVDFEGKDVPMPSEYDDFSERAHPNYADVSADVTARRELLRQVMERQGFTRFPTEWWHFDYKGWENKPNLDLSFEELDAPKSLQCP